MASQSRLLAELWQSRRDFELCTFTGVAGITTGHFEALEGVFEEVFTELFIGDAAEAVLK